MMDWSNRRALRLMFASGVVLALAGCVSILPDPEPASVVYRLETPSVTAAPAADAQIFRIDRPTAPIGLVNDRIIVSPDGKTLTRIVQANWAQSIPELIQHSFMDEMASRSSMVGVLPASGARTEYRAHLTVRNFEAVFDEGSDRAPLARVSYMATVSDASTRNLIGTYSVAKSVRADNVNVSSIVSAQSEANQTAISEIADWMEGLSLTN